MKRNSKSRGVESHTVEIEGGKHFSTKWPGIRVLPGISMIITTYKEITIVLRVIRASDLLKSWKRRFYSTIRKNIADILIIWFFQNAGNIMPFPIWFKLWRIHNSNISLDNIPNMGCITCLSRSDVVSSNLDQGEVHNIQHTRGVSNLPP
jgi:hypothetical protein